MGAFIEVGAEVSSAKGGQLKHGYKAVSTEAVQLTTLSTKLYRGVLVRVKPSSPTVWFGGPSVSPNDGENCGMPLDGGMAAEFPIDDPSDIWLVSTDDSVVYWIAV